VKERLAGFLLFLAVAVYRATLRIRRVGLENQERVLASGKPALHALWHQRMVPSILGFGYRGIVTMASRSSDGQIIATFLSLLGFRVVRGSSSRGGAPALKEMVDALSGSHRMAALTTDGPRGPARKSKPGVGLLCDALNAPALPVGASSTGASFLRSWDRFMVPRPFSRCVVFFGPPVERRPGEEEEGFLARLDAAIDEATERADALCGVLHAPRERARRAEATG
jgi:lysophospholipid acyltransferase (LPLAT)-like uncharacterized protein